MKTTLSQMLNAALVAGLLSLVAPARAAEFAERGANPALQFKIITLDPKLVTGLTAGDGATLDPLGAALREALSADGRIPADAARIAVLLPATPGQAPLSVAEPGAQAQTPEAMLTEIRAAVESLPDVTKASAGELATGGQNLSDAVAGGKSIAGTGDAAPVSAAPEAPLKEQVAWAKGILENARAQLGKVIIGHEKPIKEILIAMTAGQHVLLEGLPGDGKTQTAKTIASIFDGRYSRIQFTADLLPSDIVGVMIFDQKEQDFRFRPGPIFANIVLADEINRAPPKTHSALLEAMGEGQVTVDGNQKKLGRFTVLATQNPVEQDGTYKSPEAELDRFMFKSVFSQPSQSELIRIMRLKRFKDAPPQASQAATLADLDAIRRISERITMSDEIETYIAQLVMAAKAHDKIKENVKYSVYTRAAQFLEQAARIHAVMEGRDHVLPRDVTEMVYPIMRHRIALDYNAAESYQADDVIKKIVETTPLPRPAAAFRLAKAPTNN